ncbi:MAG: hypothetical protein ACYTGG_11180, partial [Planctomycetota bacterium]
MRKLIRTVLVRGIVLVLGGCTFRTHYGGSGYYGSYGHSYDGSHCDPGYGTWSIGYSYSDY